jgi:stage III sporulation protein AH
VIVNLTGETADVVVPDAYLEDAKRAQIEDIVRRKTGIAEENIVITSLAESSTDTDPETTEEDSQESLSEDAAVYEDDYTYLD